MIKCRQVKKGASMTYKKFVEFDTNKFYEPGYENEKKYMGYITTLAVSALNHTKFYYSEKQQNMSLMENTENRWLKTNAFIHPFLPVLPPANSLHPEAKEFIELYEKLMKKFVTSYINNYSEIASDDIKKVDYYSANSVDMIFRALTDFKETMKLDKIRFANSGFIDMRLPIIHSFESPESTKITPNSYTEEMEPLYERFESTLEKTIAQYDSTNPYDKRNRDKR
jgi:hypothetical protein